MLLIVFGYSCNQPPEPTELYNKYRNSVVLIQNSYYFKTTLDNGFEFFYTMDGDEPVFYKNEQEAIENAGISYGTGFFISSKGEIATNRHVVYPNKSTTYIADKINDYLNELRREIKKLINDEERETGKLADYYNEYYDYLDFEKKSKIREDYASKKNKIVELEKYLGEIDFNPNNTSTELKRIFLGVAFDDTHVTSFNDFSECVAIKKSDVEDIDLAIIQLKNKTTPANVNQYFKVEDIKSKTLNLNDEVFMIGFNQGIILANTKNGIKSQFTQGTITQDPDMHRILYSIPTLPGSSGSPIIDKWGNLVAINFAKTSDFQGFSFGIPSIALHNLYNDKPIQAFQNESQIAYKKESLPENNVSKNNTTTKETDFSQEIRGFVKAEEKRDFDLIYSFLSPHFSRYYDMTSPNYSKLKERYEYLWGFTSNSKNSIQSINKINDFTYDMRTIYSYYNQRKNKNFTVNSTVRFLFDSNGKIVETYGVTNDTPKPVETQNTTSTSTTATKTAPEYLKGGFETQVILEYTYNSRTNSYDLKNELQTPSKLYFDNDWYAFKRGYNQWLFANWTYSGFDEKNRIYVFYDNYGQTITFNENFKTITWYTKRGENNIFQEIITYKTLIPNKSIRPDYSNNSTANNSNNNTNSNSQKSTNNTEYTGYYKFKTTFDNPTFELPLRSEPNVNSREIYKCPKNATVYVIDNSGEIFFKVHVNGYTGYVSKGYLKRKW